MFYLYPLGFMFHFSKTILSKPYSCYMTLTQRTYTKMYQTNRPKNQGFEMFGFEKTIFWHFSVSSKPKPVRDFFVAHNTQEGEILLECLPEWSQIFNEAPSWDTVIKIYSLKRDPERVLSDTRNEVGTEYNPALKKGPIIIHL